MGFWDKVKTAVLGTKAERTPPLPTEPQERPRLDMMEYKSFDLGQRFEQIFTAIKLHDERMVKFIADSNLDVLDRLDLIIGLLKEPKTLKVAEEKLIQLKENIVFTAKLDQIVQLIKKEGTVTPAKLAELLNIKPSTAHYHLMRLVDLGVVQEIYRGSYKLKDADIAIVETPKENDSDETEAQDASAETQTPAEN